MQKRTVLSIVIITIMSLGLMAGCGLEEATDQGVTNETDTGPAGDPIDSADGQSDGNSDSAGPDSDTGPECVSDDDCNPLSMCENEVCVPAPECEVDSQCEGGFICADDGTCVLDETPVPECDDDTDCADGHVCDDAGFCVEVTDPGPECTTDADCALGEVCSADACGPAPEPAPAPVAASSGSDSEGYYCTLHFSIEYISMATCGESRGNMPGMSWDAGATIEDLDGDSVDLELIVDADAAVAGTYDLSYLGSQSCGAPTADAWAQYGGPDQLAAMTADAREFISCNWWDADAGEEIAVDGYSCGIRLNVSVLTHGDGTKDCMFLPAGNMRDYTGE